MKGDKNSTFSYNTFKNILNGYLTGMADIFDFLETYISDMSKSKHILSCISAKNWWFVT